MAEDLANSLWNKLFFQNDDIPPFEEVSDGILLHVNEVIKIAFEFSDHFENLKNDLDKRGIDWREFFKVGVYDSRREELQKIIASLDELEKLIGD